MAAGGVHSDPLEAGGAGRRPTGRVRSAHSCPRSPSASTAASATHGRSTPEPTATQPSPGRTEGLEPGASDAPRAELGRRRTNAGPKAGEPAAKHEAQGSVLSEIFRFPPRSLPGRFESGPPRFGRPRRNALLPRGAPTVEIAGHGFEPWIYGL